MEPVTIEIAKQLNDIGYPQYNSYKSYFIGDDEKRYVKIGSLINRSKRAEDFHLIAAPTISQVVKWLIDEKKLYISPKWLIDDTIKWVFQIDNLNTRRNTIYESCLIYKSYEEAAMAGIEYVLDNILV